MRDKSISKMGSRAALLSTEDRLRLEDEERASDTAIDDEPVERPPSHLRTRSQATFVSFATDKTSVSASKSAYLYAIGIALPVSLVCFTIQTELAQYIQAKLGYEKPFFMLYVTHSSWWLNGIGLWLWLRMRHPSTSSATVSRRMLDDIREVAQAVAAKSKAQDRPLLLHMAAVIVICGVCLTIAGGTWYVAVNLTTASDVSAIYNSSAFFAYAFSVPLLKEKLRLDKVVAVGISCLGVIVIAYGDVDESAGTIDSGRRTLGNIIIAVGAVLYGLYEVIYKKLGCPPDQYDPNKSIIFANAMATGLGLFTLTIMWMPLLLLHYLGWEHFELPPVKASMALAASVAANFVYSSCLLAMISLTSPLIASVASLLSIFMVAIVDTWITGKPLSWAATAGGLLIGIAFGILTWASYTELTDVTQSEDEADDDDVFDMSDDESETGETGFRART